MKITAKDQVPLVDNEQQRNSFRSELREIVQMSTNINGNDVRSTKKRKKGVLKLRFEPTKIESTITVKEDVENEPAKKRKKMEEEEPVTPEETQLDDFASLDGLDDTLDSVSSFQDTLPIQFNHDDSVISRKFSSSKSSPLVRDAKTHKNKKPEYSFILEKFPTYGRTREQNNEVNRLRMQFLRARRKFIAMLEENGEPPENIDNYSEQDILNFVKPYNRGTGSPAKDRLKEFKPRKIEKSTMPIVEQSTSSTSHIQSTVVAEPQQNYSTAWTYSATSAAQQQQPYQSDYSDIVQISNGILPGFESNRYNSDDTPSVNYWEFSTTLAPTSEINLIESIRKRNLMYNNFENL